MAVIECRGCDSPDCRGCNTYILNNMLKAGKFKAIKNENNTINAAADVVEVRRGKWKWDGFVYDAPWQCSGCGAFSEYESNYCPNCGAKMDGDGK